MLEQLKYKNHQNEVFEFGKNGIFVNTNDLHDYEWAATSKGNRISALTRKVSTRKLPVVIMCNTEEEGIAARNRMLEIMEKDVLAMQHGQVIIGDYYFKCFVTKSQKKDYLTTKKHMEVNLTLTSDYPYWVKETVTGFRLGGKGDGEESEASPWLDFPFEYPFDFFHSMANTTLNNTGFVATNFKLIIYGACSSPSITIGDHNYQVDCDVGESEHLTIDSTTKKIFLTTNDGTVINKFNDRSKTSYVFEKIKPGTSPVAWSGGFGFDIILMDERSEPKWI